MYDHAREDDWQIVTRIHNHDKLWGPKNETSTKLGFIVYCVKNMALKNQIASKYNCITFLTIFMKFSNLVSIDR